MSASPGLSGAVRDGLPRRWLKGQVGGGSQVTRGGECIQGMWEAVRWARASQAGSAPLEEIRLLCVKCEQKVYECVEYDFHYSGFKDNF